MIGTGPFKFEGGSNWVRNDHLTLVKNENYWRKDT
jgi:ABC-type transport system substrate-binding protein